MDFPGFARDNGRFCTSLPLAAEVVRVLEQETLRAGGRLPACRCVRPCLRSCVSVWCTVQIGRAGQVAALLLCTRVLREV